MIAQRDLGWSVSVLTTVQPQTDRRVIDRLTSAGIAVSVVPIGARWRSIPALRSAVKALVSDVDCLHVHAVWEELQHQACQIARRSGVPYIVSPHGMLDPWSLAQGRGRKRAYLILRLRRILNGAAAIHCTTRTEAKLLEPLRLASNKVVVPNGIDLAEFADDAFESSAASFLQQYPQLVGKTLLLFLSRLHPKKGLDLLLPAFARAKTDDVVLVLAGPGDQAYRDQLARDVRRLGIENRVVFTGMLHNKERVAALRAADLYVLPSYQENFGIAVVEALAAGTPVIISDQVNLADELRTKGVGAIVSTNEDSLCVALEHWLSNADMRERAASAAPAVARKYAFDQVAQQWSDVHRRLRDSSKTTSLAPSPLDRRGQGEGC